MSNSAALFVVSGPAGSGKTTLVDLLHKEYPRCIKNVSFTTRAKREGEKDGIDYFFVTKEKFDEMVKRDEFLEHIELFGNSYGTSKAWIASQLDEGKLVFLAIDVRGGLSIRNEIEATYIFVMPPSVETLEERLLSRDSEEAEERQKRLSRATEEMEKAKQYDHIVINDVLQEAYEEFKKIIFTKGVL